MGHLSGVGNADSRDHYSFVQHSLALFTLLSCHSPSCCDQRLFSNSGSFDMIDCSRSEISDKSLGADGLLTQRGCTGSSGAFPAWCIYENQNPKKQPLQRSPCAPPEPFQLNSPPPVTRVGHELLHGCSQREIVCVCACVRPSLGATSPRLCSTSRDGDPTITLGSLCHCITALPKKKCALISNTWEGVTCSTFGVFPHNQALGGALVIPIKSWGEGEKKKAENTF